MSACVQRRKQWQGEREERNTCVTASQRQWRRDKSGRLLLASAAPAAAPDWRRLAIICSARGLTCTLSFPSRRSRKRNAPVHLRRCCRSRAARAARRPAALPPTGRPVQVGSGTGTTAWPARAAREAKRRIVCVRLVFVLQLDGRADLAGRLADLFDHHLKSCSRGFVALRRADPVGGALA